MKKAKSKPNELIRFLEGIWTTRDITITPKKEVKITECREVMKMKDSETITITALGIEKGKDVTRDMTIKLEGDKVTMSQRDFTAKGIKNGNLVTQGNLPEPDIRLSFVSHGRQIRLPKRCLGEQ